MAFPASLSGRVKAGDVWNADTDVVTTKEERAQTRRTQQAKSASQRQIAQEQDRKRRSGESTHSKRQQERRAREYAQESASVLSPDAEIHYMRGDSDNEFETEGLRGRVTKRINIIHQQQVSFLGNVATSVEKQHEEQAKALEEDIDMGGDSASANSELVSIWSKIPESVQREILQAYITAKNSPDEIHHSAGDRPVYISAQLYLNSPEKRPTLKPNTRHTGQAGNHDDLSHSIPWAQAPPNTRILGDGEGGVNHPKNIPYENYLTNQDVNVAIEDIGRDYMLTGKKVTKVVVRYWHGEHVQQSLHVYFVEGVTDKDSPGTHTPLVFPTGDLGNKKPSYVTHR